jgi:hypothetical protein
VQLSWSGSPTPFRTVSLASPVTIQRKFIPVLDDYSESSRTLVVKVASSGKPVIIDGLLTTMLWTAPAWAIGSSPPVPASATSNQPALGLAASFDGSCAVKTDNTVACWGNNDENKALPPAGTYIAVTQGDYHSCAIRTDGTLACWGYNVLGELAPPEDGPYTAIAAGARDTCAIRDDGGVDCWGWSFFDGEVQEPEGTFVAIAAERWDFCGIRPDGSIACWGEAYEYGDLAPPSGTFKAVSARCAIREDDTVQCWGNNSMGQATPPGGAFQAIASGGLHTCGIRSDDTLACWGDNNYFESSPPAGTFKAVVAGWAHACAIASDDTIACWGHDGSSQVVPRPIAALKGLSGWLTTTTVGMSWTASGLAPVASYDVRYRKAAWNGPFGAATSLRSATTSTSTSFAGTPGTTYCLAVRARDTDGLTSSWTGETCTGVPLDDRALSRAGSWTKGSGSAYYKSTYTRSSTKGATLTRSGVSTKRIVLVATTCPTCGKVGVYWGTTLLKTISLTSATTVHRKVISVATFSSVRTGTLRIKVVSSGKKVIIDGVGLRRS